MRERERRNPDKIFVFNLGFLLPKIVIITLWKWIRHIKQAPIFYPSVLGKRRGKKKSILLRSPESPNATASLTLDDTVY